MRLAVLADIHGNLPALEAVVADLAGRRVGRVVNLGDCVSGPLWPRETLELLRARDWPTVRGNHDRVVGHAASASPLGASDRFAFDELTVTDQAWLAALPDRLDSADLLRGDGAAGAREYGEIFSPEERANLAPVRLVAIHARPGDDNAYLLEDQRGKHLFLADPATIRARLGPIRVDLVLTGHSHLQRSLQLPDGPLVVNPGSVGCPAYDDVSTEPPHVSEQGSPAARYAIVEQRPEGFLLELLSIPYDHLSAAKRARTNGRLDWAHALTTGFSLPVGVEA